MKGNLSKAEGSAAEGDRGKQKATELCKETCDKEIAPVPNNEPLTNLPISSDPQELEVLLKKAVEAMVQLGIDKALVKPAFEKLIHLGDYLKSFTNNDFSALATDILDQGVGKAEKGMGEPESPLKGMPHRAEGGSALTLNSSTSSSSGSRRASKETVFDYQHAQMRATKQMRGQSLVSKAVGDECYFHLFPDCLIFGWILPRVDAKAVGRFRCVSRSWNSTLKSTFFKDEFFKQSSKRRYVLSSRTSDYSDLRFVSSNPPDSEKMASVLTKISYPGSTFVLQVVEGLCLVVHQSVCKMEVWFGIFNPTTGEGCLLPELSHEKEPFFDICNHRYLGYDFEGKKYKVLARVNDGVVKGQQTQHFEVLTLGPGELAWRTIDCAIPHTARVFQFACCIKGVIYYLASVPSSGKVSMIMAFNVRSEQFTSIVFTVPIQYKDQDSLFLMENPDNSLCIFKTAQGDLAILVKQAMGNSGFCIFKGTEHEWVVDQLPPSPRWVVYHRFEDFLGVAGDNFVWSHHIHNKRKLLSYNTKTARWVVTENPVLGREDISTLEPRFHCLDFMETLESPWQGMPENVSELAVMDTQTFTQLPEQQLHTEGICSLDIFQDVIAIGGLDATAVIFNRRSGKILSTLTGHSEKVTSVKFVGGTDLVLTASSDKTVCIWRDLEDGRYDCAHKLSGHYAEVRAIAVHATKKYFVSAALDSMWRLYDVSSGSCIAQGLDYSTKGGFTAAAFHPDGLTLGTGDSQSVVRIWDVNSQARVAAFHGHTGAVTSIAFSKNGDLLATAAGNGVRLWDVRMRKEFKKLTSADAVSVDFDPIGSNYFCVAASEGISVFETRDWTAIDTFPFHTGGMCLKFGQDFFAVGSPESSILQLFGRPI